MGANNHLVALYGISAVMAFASAFLPGVGALGRACSVVWGLALIGWPASAFVSSSPPELSPTVIAVPPTLLVYGLLVVIRHLRIQSSARPRLDDEPWTRGEGRVERRGPGRRALPGEFGDVPVNQAPERHDPWAALYASGERRRMRGGDATGSASCAARASFSAMRTYTDGQPTAMSRLASESPPPWYLSNIEEVSRRDAPKRNS